MNDPVSCEQSTALDEAELWSRWREQGDSEAREALLTLYAGYARVIAASCYARRYHDGIDFDDYEQLAVMGMLEAFDRFDHSRGVLFRTFSSRRIHGAILDGLERMTEVQQQIAAHKRLRDERRLSLIDEHSQSPTQSPQQIMDFVAEVGMGLAVAWLLDGTGMVDPGEASVNRPFYHSAEVAQLRESLLDCVNALPEQQRRVVIYHYLQGIPFQQISSMMELTKGRISQIHKQAILALRGALRPRPNPG